MLSRFAAATLLLAFLAGCASVPAPLPVAAPGYGAPTGASGRAAADPRIASLTAAGAKPLTGASVAAYMTRQEQELHTQLDGKGVTITRAGNQLVVDLPVDVAFDLGMTGLKPQAKAALAAIGLVLKHFDKTIVDVYGYTDTQSAPSAGKDLSQKRAVAVATVLAAQGVDQDRFYIEGRGAADPIASNATEPGRSQNRRVDIQISPLI